MIVNNGYIRGSEFWANSGEMSFKEIQSFSRVPERWAKFNYIEKEYYELPVKPVNRYVSNLYPRPELVSMDNGLVRLRQKTHAEIWVSPKENDGLYALDKTWQRQFYPSSTTFDSDQCFKATYRFYIPWFIDLDIEARIENVVGNEVFVLEDRDISFSIKDLSKDDSDVQFVNFKIKTSGPHMKTSAYGIIDIATPMYDIVFKVSEEEVEKIARQYR